MAELSKSKVMLTKRKPEQVKGKLAEATELLDLAKGGEAESLPAAIKLFEDLLKIMKEEHR